MLDGFWWVYVCILVLFCELCLYRCLVLSIVMFVYLVGFGDVMFVCWVCVSCVMFVFLMCCWQVTVVF